MPKLTKAQQTAVDEQSKTLLVSAAAGSGKTFTLVERVLRSVVREEKPIPIDRLLVVTFTKDTANDLKQRISNAISEATAKSGGNEHLVRQMSLLPSAKFSTIDSFYLSLVRANYATLGLSPTFRMADEGESALIESETMERLIARCYDDESSTICGGPRGFARLVDTLVGNGSDYRLSEILFSVFKVLNSYPKGAKALIDTANDLYEYANGDFFDCPYGKRVQNYITDIFSHYEAAFKKAMEMMVSDEALSKSYLITYAIDYESIQSALLALKAGYSKGRDAIANISFPTLKSYKGEKSEFVSNLQAMRNDFKDDVKEIKAKYLFSNSEEIKRAILETAEICKNLGEFLIEFERMLEAEKKRKNICTFSDLSRYSLRLLVDEDGNDTPFADEQKKLYDAIYIDEYQDVNAVQNRIFDAISTPTNRFMVGDIKQSIYAFRGAEPSIFASLRRDYPSYSDAERSPNAALFMSQNFRCNKEILDFTNHVCDLLMPLISPEMNYSKEDALVFGKVRESDRAFPVEMVAIENAPKDSPLAKVNLEAEWVADEIYRLTHGQTKDNGSPITPGDIAILMRAPKSKADTYANALRSRGIPVSAETDENLLLQSEISIVRAFLECIDNPRRDISLAAALLSPLANIDCNFISTLKNRNGRLITAVRDFALNGDGENKEKLSRFLEKLDGFRKMARYMSSGEFIDTLYADMAIPMILGGNSKYRRANLEKFRQSAYSCSASSTSLASFLRYLRSIENAGKTITAAKVDGGDDEAVHIMSVHKSKGLEYPVVFYANTLGMHANNMELTSPLYINGVGFGLRLRDESGFCVYDTMLRQSVEIAKKQSEKEEELRKLYVALTRARERLYVCGKTNDASKTFGKAEFENKFVSRHLALSKTAHFDIMMLALGGEETEYVKYRTVNASDIDFESKEADAVVVNAAEANENVAKLLTERFDYNYPNLARTKIPAKLSISRLYPDILDDAVLEVENGEKPLPKAVDAPRFIKNDENIAAKRGTATHLFMQFFDFDYAAENGVEKELCRLVEKHFITEDDASLVNIEEVKTFIASPLFRQMRGATRIYREKRFNLHLPASEFASDENLKAELEKEEVLVQGVIDCFFYDGEDIILVDYKTDRVFGDRNAAEEALRAAHSRQLSYYARAIEEICGVSPKKTVIYSLALGDEVIV